MAERVLIKKYVNRRLYDTQKSAYVTLIQVSDMIKEGRNVEVIDVKTGEDVTAFILTQIVVEEARNNKAPLPASLLHLIIKHGETVLSEFFDKYLELTIRNYLNYKTTLDEQFKQWLDLGSNLSALPQQNMSSFPSFQSFMDLFTDSTKKLGDQQEKSRGDATGGSKR